MPSRLTHEYVAYEYKSGNIELLSEYKGSAAKNDLRCMICDHRWKTKYGSFQQGVGCPNCTTISTANKARHSHEFIAEQYLSRNIKLLSWCERIPHLLRSKVGDESNLTAQWLR